MSQKPERLANTHFPSAERIVISGREIRIIENPDKNSIKRLNRISFTGISHHPQYQLPWSVWHFGQIVKFTDQKEEAVETLGKILEIQKNL